MPLSVSLKPKCGRSEVVSAARLLINAARQVVQEIDTPYEGYDADLVSQFTSVLQSLRDEPTEAAQRRAVATLLRGFASQVNVNLEEE